MHYTPGPLAAIPAMAISVLTASISVTIIVSVLVFHTSVSKPLRDKPKSLKCVQDYIKIKSCNQLMERIICHTTCP